jgi:hypothetical protein
MIKNINDTGIFSKISDFIKERKALTRLKHSKEIFETIEKLNASKSDLHNLLLDGEMYLQLNDKNWLMEKFVDLHINLSSIESKSEKLQLYFDYIITYLMTNQDSITIDDKQNKFGNELTRIVNILKLIDKQINNNDILSRDFFEAEGAIKKYIKHENEGYRFLSKFKSKDSFSDIKINGQFLLDIDHELRSMQKQYYFVLKMILKLSLHMNKSLNVLGVTPINFNIPKGERLHGNILSTTLDTLKLINYSMKKSVFTENQIEKVVSYISNSSVIENVITEILDKIYTDLNEKNNLEIEKELQNMHLYLSIHNSYFHEINDLTWELIIGYKDDLGYYWL